MRTTTATLFLILFTYCLDVAAKCPNWCSKHGVCTAPNDLGYCICEHGYTGDDCSIQLCPKAYEPVSLEDRPNRRTILLTTKHDGGKMYGDLLFEFGSTALKMKADASQYTSEQCTSDFKSFKPVSEVNCIRETYDADTGLGSYLITFQKWPIYPYENNIFHHNGNPDINLFNCNTSRVDHEEAKDLICEITDVVTENLPEYLECGGRGSCLRNGSCLCERGFYGAACDSLTDNIDKMVHYHDGPFFTATILKVRMIRDPSPKFNLFHAEVATGTETSPSYHTTIRGDGMLIHKGILNITGMSVMSVDKENSNNVLSLTSNVTKNVNFTMLRTEVQSTQMHIQSYTQGVEVLSVSSEGNIATTGSITAANGTLYAHNGILEVENVKISNSLDVHGSIHLEDSLTLGAGFVLTPEGMTVDVTHHTGSLLELRSDEIAFNGSLFEIHSKASNHSLLKTVVNGRTTFDLTSTGDITTHSLHMQTGGIRVEAGGVQIDAGGLHVDGGVYIASGGLEISQQELNLKRLISSSDDHISPNVLVNNINKNFIGTVLQLEALVDNNNNNDLFNYITAINSKTKDKLFELTSQGHLKLSGSIYSNKGAQLSGNTNILGRISWKKSSMLASDSIIIPSTVGYIIIENDNKISKNVLVLGTIDSGVTDGQLLIITNNDMEPTMNPSIPSGSTVMLLFNGHIWTDIAALKAPMQELRGVRTLEAVNDLYIGNVTVEMGRIRLQQITRGAVPFSGVGGVLVGSEAFTYSKGVLSSPSLRVDRLSSDIDASGFSLSNTIIADSKIKNTSIIANDITIPGLTGLAVFNGKGQLVVSTGLKLDVEGQIIIEDVTSNVNFHQYHVVNATINDCNLTNIRIASVENLLLPSQSVGSLAVYGVGGELSSANMTVIEDELIVHKLKAFKLSGNIDANGHMLSNIQISGGNISDVKTISGAALTITSLSGDGDRVAIINANGDMTADNGSIVYISKVHTDSVHVTNTLEMGTNSVLKANEIHSNKATVSTLTATNIILPDITHTDDTYSFIGIDETTGNIIKSNDIYIENQILKMNTVTINSLDINDLTFSSLKSTLLAVDKEGKTIGTDELNIRLVNVTDMTVSGLTTLSGTLQFTNISSSLLSVDEYGKVVHTDSFIVKDMSSESLTVGHIIVKNKIRLEGIVTEGDNGTGGTGGSGTGVLIVNGEGDVMRNNYLVVDSVSTDNAIINSSLVVAGTITLKNIIPGLLIVDEFGTSPLVVDGDLSVNSIFIKGDVSTHGSMKLTGVTSSLLYADNTGVISGTDNIKLSTIESDHINVMGNITTKGLILDGIAYGSGVAIIDDIGSISSSKILNVDEISTATLSVQGTSTLDGGVQLTNIKSALLSTDDTGAIIGTTTVSVPNIISSTAKIGTAIVEESLHINTLNNALLSTDNNGKMIKTESIDVRSVSTTDITVHGGTASLDSLKIKTLQSTLLYADNDGSVIASDSLTTSSVTATTVAVSGLTTLSGTLQFTNISSSLLSVDENGKVVHTDSFIVKDMSSESLTVGHIIVKNKIRLDGIHGIGGTGTGTGVLTVNGEGDVIKVSTANIPELFVDNMTASGTVEMNSLVIKGLITSDSNGFIRSSTAIIVKNITTDSISTGTITLKNIIPGLLVVNEFGTVSSSSDSSSNKGNNNNNNKSPLVVDGDLSVNSIFIKGDVSTHGSMKLTAVTNSLLYADNTGTIVPATSISLQHTSTSTMHCEETASLKGLQIRELSSTLLSVDATGQVQGTNTLTVSDITTDTMNVQNSFQTKKITLENIKSSLLAVDEKGVVIGTTTMSVEDISTKSLNVHGSIDSASIILRDVKSALLSTNEKGLIVPTEHVDIKSVTTDSISSRDIRITSKLYLNPDDSSSSSGSVKSKSQHVLSSNTDGEVIRVTDVQLDNLQTNSIVSTGLIQGTSVRITGLKSALLATNAEGVVHEVDSIENMKTISTSDIHVKNTATLTNLKITGLKPSILSVTADGNVISTDSFIVKSIQSADATVDELIIKNKLRIDGFTPGSILITGRDNSIITSDSIAINSITSSKMTVTGPVDMESLQVKGLASKSDSMELVIADKLGQMSTMRLSELSLPLPNTLQADSLNIKDETKLSHLILKDMKSGILMTNSDGKVSSTTDISLPTATLKTLTVTEKASVESISLQNIKNSILSTDSTGSVTALNGIKIIDEGIYVKNMKIDSIRGDVDFGGYKLNKVILKDATIEDSDIMLSNTANGFGAIVVKNKDGKLTPSALKVDANGGILANSIGPSSDSSSSSSSSTIAITSALISDSKLQRVSISATDLSATSLSVSGQGDVGKDLYVGGSVTVQGSVIGSGPYIDTSDMRFKKDIEYITNALDIVTLLAGVRYNYKTEEFPEKNFATALQIGWIADDVQRVAPELVIEDEKGYKHVAYARSTALLATAIKELQETFREYVKESFVNYEKERNQKECSCTSTSTSSSMDEDTLESERAASSAAAAAALFPYHHHPSSTRRMAGAGSTSLSSPVRGVGIGVGVNYGDNIGSSSSSGTGSSDIGISRSNFKI
eukprot:gene1065-2084_t